jgi:hypothetical protein
MENQPKRRLLPDSQVQERYGKTAETLRNWERDPKMGFAQPVWINRRKYRSETELDAFDRRCAEARVKGAK